MGSRTHLLDVSIIFPLQPDLLSSASASHGGAATLCEKRKMERYGGLTSQLGASFVFVPILVDTFGAFGASAIPWITRAAVLAGRRFSVHPSQAIPLAFQRLSSTLTRALVNIVRVNADDSHSSSSSLVTVL